MLNKRICSYMDSTPRRSTLSIIIPCYNEAGTIGEVLARVETAQLPDGWEREIIVVDDASTDATRTVLSELATTARIIYRTINGGKGAAVKDGLGVATGDYCIIQDADLELDPSDYPALIRPLTEGKAEAVFGYRVMPAGTIAASPFLFLGGRVLSLVYNVCFGAHFRDIPCCYKVFPRDAIPALCATPSQDFVFDAIEMTRVLQQAHSIAQVPVTYRPRSHADGKKIFMRHGLYCLLAIGLMRVGLHQKPLDQEFPRLLRYLVAGVATVLLNLGVLYLCTDWLHIWYLTSSVIAFVVSYCVNFSLHKFWIFESTDLSKMTRELPMHLMLALTNLLVNTALLYVMVEHLHVWYLAAQIIAAVIIAVESFLILSRFIFKYT